jgi:hypothetical protein
MNTQPTVTTGTVCNPELFKFPAVKKRLVAASFSGGDVTSDGGLPLLRQLDRRLGLTKAMAEVLPDPRDPALIEHSQQTLLRQRIYGLCHGYEDLNDHDALRLDPAWPILDGNPGTDPAALAKRKLPMAIKFNIGTTVGRAGSPLPAAVARQSLLFHHAGTHGVTRPKNRAI